MSEKLRVCMVTPLYPPAYSGSGRQCAVLSEGLARHGHVVRVLTSHARTSGMPAREDTSGALGVVRLGDIAIEERWGTYVWGFRVAYELWRSRDRYRLVHFHGVNLWALPALLMARGLGKGIIVKVTTLGHDDPVGLARERAGAIKSRLFELADAIVGNSRGVREAFGAHRAGGRVYVIPNGLDTDSFQPADSRRRKDLRSEFGLPQDRRIAVCVSSVVPRKGITFLLEVWRRLKQNSDVPLLLILGAMDVAPDYAHRILSRIEVEDLDSDIQLLGYLPNVEEYLQASDLFVFASNAEGLPSAVIEAMSCGLPVVVRRIPGVTETLMNDGEEGFVIPSQDSAGFARAVQTLIASTSTVENRGVRARATAVSRFGLGRMVEEYIKLYRAI